MFSAFKNFGKPTVAKQQQDELTQMEDALYKAELQIDYYKSQVEFYKTRIEKLKQAKNSATKPVVEPTL